MHRREATSWHQMTLHYGLANAWKLDSFRKMSKKEFTFDNERVGACSVVSRIDKFMISQDIEERGGRIETAASVRKLSDHSPLIITMWGHHPPPGNPTRYFDTSILNEDESKRKMLEAWDGDHSRPENEHEWPTWLEAAIGRVMLSNSHLSKEKRRSQGIHIRTHAKKIQLAEIQLQRDPTNAEVRDILSNAQGKLAEVFQDSVTRNCHMSSAKWLKYGDTCSKTFFDFHHIGKKKALLRELEIESRTITGQRDLIQFITDFYARLYTSDALAPGTAEAQEQCWTSVPIKVLEDTNSYLTRNLTLTEVHDAIRALPKGKALGHDGLPMEFFHECAQEVAPDLLRAFAAMLNAGETSAHINKGLITLIPKSGDYARLGNWRPITLLCSSYKILAKVLAGRVQAALPQIIRPNQTGFVEGRSILDNVFIA